MQQHRSSVVARATTTMTAASWNIVITDLGTLGIIGTLVMIERPWYEHAEAAAELRSRLMDEGLTVDGVTVDVDATNPDHVHTITAYASIADTRTGSSTSPVDADPGNDTSDQAPTEPLPPTPQDLLVLRTISAEASSMTAAMWSDHAVETIETIDRHPVVATATWTPLLGDPAAAERSRWMVDTPTVGHVGVIDLPRTALAEVCAQLRDLIESDGTPVTYLSHGAGVVAAHGAVAPAVELRIPVTNNGAIATQLRELADVIEQAGTDLPEPTLSFYCGATTLPGPGSERIEAEVRAAADILGLPEPTITIESHMCPISSKMPGVVTVMISGYIAKPPGTCHCGRACTHGDVS